MKIEILGTRGEIKNLKPYHAKHSGVFIDNDLLFDLGEKEYLKLNPEHIFITHLHPDHAFFARKG
jgi:glyoxylase-like metal-dependent hydrolase (beta-lactamase superfamily II)